MEFEFVSPNEPSKCRWKPNAADSPHCPNHKIQQARNSTDCKNAIMPNILRAIGQTPMVRLDRIAKNHGVECEILAKCEFMNPGGSVKDRIAFRMVEDAEAKGVLKPGLSTIIEPTSGNTGVGLALVCAVKGYRCIVVMSERFADEKGEIMRALGAEIVRTPIDDTWNSPDGPHAVAQRMQRRIPDSVILYQFANPENPLVHYNQTASEIWEQCDGKIDYLVGGLGTGGTVSGIGRRLRELSPSTKIVVADPRIPPADDCLDPEDRLHHVEGIGIGFLPTATDLGVIDVHVKTDQKECLNLARELSRQEGLLCGGSSGACLLAALSVAKGLPADKRVVVIFPDTVRNYMTKFASDSWMEWKGFMDPPKPLECNERWWDLTVSRVPLRKLVVLASQTTCEKALEFLREGGIREVPIADDAGRVKGMITLDKLLGRLIAGELKRSELATKACVTQFKRVTKTTTLGRLSRIIRQSLYAAVFDEDNGNAFLGILTQSDLFDFIESCN